MVSRLMKSKLWWCVLIAGVLAVNWIASLIHFRADLTSEKRFTLSSATRKLIRSIPDQVTVDVFLSGEMPAEFRNLRNATEELLQEFRENSKAKLVIRFSKPGEGMEDTARQAFLGLSRQYWITSHQCEGPVPAGRITGRKTGLSRGPGES